MKKASIEELSTQHGLSVEFLNELEAKIVAKENYPRRQDVCGWVVAL